MKQPQFKVLGENKESPRKHTQSKFKSQVNVQGVVVNTIQEIKAQNSEENPKAFQVWEFPSLKWQATMNKYTHSVAKMELKKLFKCLVGEIYISSKETLSRKVHC